MRIGVVWKLFLLTTALCMLILAIIYVGQTFFFRAILCKSQAE
ncbi:hypothetical protein CLV36_10715 [Laceyella sediminis]|uniref:Uncharacterized protein n=1 Tax=Laceyella sediminis TaxID=573074 RepID=A0ABX5EQM3_9BACL|nr:hypothetical protein CLV36_10715 [Laceyella sediminis]